MSTTARWEAVPEPSPMIPGGSWYELKRILFADTDLAPAAETFIEQGDSTYHYLKGFRDGTDPDRDDYEDVTALLAAIDGFGKVRVWIGE